jgi:trans-2,3-dihydro-3-hydroxyanthranilate isomerase
MMRRYRTVDVFTRKMFGGNPLAVVLDGDGLDDSQMQAIAKEFNYSETSFIRRPLNPQHTAEVRIFTPSITVAVLLLGARAERSPGELCARVTMR